MEHKQICDLTPTEFEKYCCEFLAGFAEKGKLQDFKITHNKILKASDGRYQIDVYAEQMSPQQMALFCMAGPLATLIAGWAMVLCVKQICAIRSTVVKACAWYTSITMLVLDELYLGVFYRWVGGGDMNGIKLMIPEGVVSAVAIVIGVANVLIIWKLLFPAYTKSFATER